MDSTVALWSTIQLFLDQLAIDLKLETDLTDQCFCVDGRAPENDTESTLMHLIIHEQIRMFKFMFHIVLCEVIKMGGK